MIRFHCHTFGCQMNVRDSDWLCAALEHKGWQKTGADEADIILLNTCAVRAKPELRVQNYILQIAATKPRMMIAVLGCVAQQLGNRLFSIAPQVRLVAGTDAVALIPAALENMLHSPAPVSLLDFSPDITERANYPEACPSRSAFVTIMQGCDNFCSYCIVPFTRGRQKSRSYGNILRECRTWLERGAREICLLGQNVNVWGGRGAKADRAFATLLTDIAKMDGLERLRFVTPHPADMGPEAIECFGRLPNLSPRLHLPLQAGSDSILKAMRRRHTREDYHLLVERLRQARPDLALSTDLIVGFPGETESDFQQTLELVEECDFISSYSFIFSPRPGTRAALMPDNTEAEEKLDRLKRLQSLQDRMTAVHLQKQIGLETVILIEGPSPRGASGSWQGRDPYGQCVNVTLPGTGDPTGEFIPVTITEAKKHSLLARTRQ